MKYGSLLVVIFVIILALAGFSAQTATALSFRKQLEFEVEGYNYIYYNETHDSLIVLINLTNDSDYDELIYKSNFWATNSTPVRYDSETTGAFRILPGTREVFTLNFTIPRGQKMSRLIFETSSGRQEYEIELDPEEDDGTGSNDVDIWDVVFILILGGVFITVLALIFIITSHKKKRERRFRFLKY